MSLPGFGPMAATQELQALPFELFELAKILRKQLIL